MTREDSELIKKVYLKQKEVQTRGDWILNLQSDYALIGEDLEEVERCIKITSKKLFIKNMKYKVVKASFQCYLDMKQECKKKMNKLNYDEFRIQKYLI